ncbi:hypothetical protein SNARM312S_01491 [Streptomyces narbonensis]
MIPFRILSVATWCPIFIKWGNAHRGRPGRDRDRPVALGQRVRDRLARRRGGPAARAARRVGAADRGGRPVPFSPGRLERDRRGRQPGRRGGHPRRGPAADHGRARTGDPYRTEQVEAADRGQRLPAGRHPPGGRRAAARDRRAHPDHRRLAPLPRGLPPRRGTGPRRGPFDGRGAAGGGLAVDAGLLARRARRLRRGGRPADRHRPPRGGGAEAPATSAHPRQRLRPDRLRTGRRRHRPLRRGPRLPRGARRGHGPGRRALDLAHPPRPRPHGRDLRPARRGPARARGHDLHRLRHHDYRAGTAHGPGVLPQPRAVPRRRRPQTARIPAAPLRQPRHRRLLRRQDPHLLQLRLLRRPHAEPGDRGERARERPQAGGAAGDAAAVGDARQPVGAHRGRREVPGRRSHRCGR